jgi:hypothetical protein
MLHSIFCHWAQIDDELGGRSAQQEFPRFEIFIKSFDWWTVPFAIFCLAFHPVSSLAEKSRHYSCRSKSKKRETMRVFIRSRRCDGFARDGHPALKSNPDGHVQADFGKAEGWEEWELETIDGGTDDVCCVYVTLRAWTGNYLSAKPDGHVAADCDHIGPWEKWQMQTSNEPYVSFKSHFGKHLVCDGNSFLCRRVRADRHEVQAWEEWVIVKEPDAMTNPGHTAKLAIGGTLVAAGTLLTFGALAVPMLGFGVGGVAAGSAAAGIQSLAYGGATCGAFSVLQMAGATLAWIPVASGAAAASATGVAVLKNS